LGRLLGALAEGAPRSLEVEHRGKLLELPTGPITAAALAGYLEATLGRPVNRVSAGLLAKERGLSVREVRSDEDADYVALVSLRLETATGPRLLAGTLFGRREPRLVRLDGYEMDARPEGDLLIGANDDRPGIIGRIGTMLGAANVNIAHCAVGRDRTGGRALAYLNVDSPVPAEVADALARSPGMIWVRRAHL
ncbi:MAG: ACT domain-containing protein, partial [Planctomycetales bacterium]|nr:ACT domain-containing protein [Planctomycetales bacterium]